VGVEAGGKGGERVDGPKRKPSGFLWATRLISDYSASRTTAVRMNREKGTQRKTEVEKKKPE